MLILIPINNVKAGFFIYLNTSHVNLNLIQMPLSMEVLLHLNTSHVNLNLFYFSSNSYELSDLKKNKKD